MCIENNKMYAGIEFNISELGSICRNIVEIHILNFF